MSDYVGAVEQSDLALARAIMEQGIVSGDDELLSVLDGVGDIEIVDGVGDIDIVGAKPGVRRISMGNFRGLMQNAAARGAAAHRMAMAGRFAGGGGGQQPAARPGGAPSVVQRPPDGNTFTRWLPVTRDQFTNGGLIAAGAEAEIPATPQGPFRPTAFFVDDETSHDFLILDISIGTETIFVSRTGGIPASSLRGESSTLAELFLRTAQTTQTLSVRVRNRSSGDARAFYGFFKGWGVQ